MAEMQGKSPNFLLKMNKIPYFLTDIRLSFSTTVVVFSSLYLQFVHVRNLPKPLRNYQSQLKPDFKV